MSWLVEEHYIQYFHAVPISDATTTVFFGKITNAWRIDFNMTPEERNIYEEGHAGRLVRVSKRRNIVLDLKGLLSGVWGFWGELEYVTA
jgi:hypothetical protein